MDTENISIKDNVLPSESNKSHQYELIKKNSTDLSFTKYKNPEVSIIIPVFNNYQYTLLCLQSVLENTGDIKYEIIIGDDNSTDETRDIEKHIKNIRVEKNTLEKGFVNNCNHAAKAARGEFLLFLNNDIQVQKNWLKPLISAMKNDSNVGLVGSKLIYPDGSLQEAGGIVYRDGSACNYGQGENPKEIWLNYVKEVDYISGASIMLRKKTWELLGGFDVHFCPAYYEDTDLAFQIRYRLNKKILYIPKSEVIHFEGKSNGTDSRTGVKHWQVLNKIKFFNKWKKELGIYHAAPTTNNFLTRDHSYKRKNILVIDWKILSFTKDTGSRSTFQYMKLFQEMGFNVKLYPHDHRIEDDFLDRHLEEGIEVIQENFLSYIQKYGCNFDYIYLNRPNIALFYIDALRNHTRAKIIYQCHDLHYLRQYRTRILTNASEASQLFEIEKSSEIELFKKMDVVCSFSYDEIRIIKKEAPSVTTKQIPLFIYNVDTMRRFTYDAEERFNIMFVAGFQHTPNVDAAVWFVEKVFPSVLLNNRNVKLYLVGSNPTLQVKKLASSHVIVTGCVSDKKLDDFYSKIRLVVVPLRCGAGVKGKIIESVYHKVPVITTTVGIEGIDNREKTIEVIDGEENLINSINTLYKDVATLNKMSESSYKFIEKYFSKEVAIESLSEIL